jgi:hypothetical protein
MARPTNPGDPTDERTADQSTPSSGGLTSGRPDRMRDTGRDDRLRSVPPEDEDLIGRNREKRHETPRRYDDDADRDAVMPANDSSLNTKI